MSIRERLYLQEREESILVRDCSDARYVWNLGLEQRNTWTKDRTWRVTSNTQSHELAGVRKDAWLGEGSSAIQQQALRDLDRAFQNWWKRPDHFGRPTWRKAGTNESFAVHRSFGEAHQ